MATGYLNTGEIVAGSAGVQPAWDAVGDQWPVPGVAMEEISLSRIGTLTDTQPVDEVGLALSGGFSPCFVADWYNRIHVDPTVYELGNVISAASLPVTFWNAYFEARTITDITDPSEGIEIVGPVPPVIMRSLSTLTYTLNVGLEGPPVIDDDITFTFDIGAFTISVDGSRILPWLFQPNGEVLERLEWMTNVIQSYNGAEQRQQMRKTPRRTFEYAFSISDQNRQQAENLLFGWQARNFALPVWMDGDVLDAVLPAASLTINVETADRDYHGNGIAILFTSPTEYEVVNVQTVAPGSLTLVRETISEWPAGTKVYPVRLARLPESVGLRRFTGGDAYGRAIWQCTDLSEYDAAVESTYQGYPVLEQPPNWTEDVEQGYLRKMAILDARTGGRYYDDEAGLPVLRQSHRWLHTDRSEISAFRSWLYARKGRLSAFWLPSWSRDLTLTLTVGALDTALEVELCHYTKQVAQRVGRRDIRIKLHDGTVLYRRITGSEELSATVERLTIDEAPGMTITPEQVAVISFMTLSRLDGDAAEIAWWTWQHAESALRTRSATNDV